uniref:Uncharacterized protein n=1 Tax=Anguilla anguilla TaxID=7936 RepID=A0A0E9Q004_ANGAN
MKRLCRRGCAPLACRRECPPPQVPTAAQQLCNRHTF